MGVKSMSMKKEQWVRERRQGLAAPSATHERILRLLGMTRRPLRSGELESALGLVTQEARSACSWLTENGYISSTVRMRKVAAHWARTFWSLADKGRSWARAQGALVT
jgi:DNA-binding transcriptional ArsR family regulator